MLRLSETCTILSNFHRFDETRQRRSHETLHPLTDIKFKPISLAGRNILQYLQSRAPPQRKIPQITAVKMNELVRRKRWKLSVRERRRENIGTLTRIHESVIRA